VPWIVMHYRSSVSNQALAAFPSLAKIPTVNMAKKITKFALMYDKFYFGAKTDDTYIRKTLFGGSEGPNPTPAPSLATPAPVTTPAPVAAPAGSSKATYTFEIQQSKWFQIGLANENFGKDASSSAGKQDCGTCSSANFAMFYNHKSNRHNGQLVEGSGAEGNPRAGAVPPNGAKTVKFEVDCSAHTVTMTFDGKSYAGKYPTSWKKVYPAFGNQGGPIKVKLSGCTGGSGSCTWLGNSDVYQINSGWKGTRATFEMCGSTSAGSCKRVAVKLSSKHPSTDVAAGSCVNGKSSRSQCESYCASQTGCNGFWYYTNGRCCPKASWSSSFNRQISGGDGFYSYSCQGAKQADLTAVSAYKACTQWAAEDSVITRFPDNVAKCCYTSGGADCNTCVTSRHPVVLKGKDPKNWVKSNGQSCLGCCATCNGNNCPKDWQPK